MMMKPLAAFFVISIALTGTTDAAEPPRPLTVQDLYLRCETVKFVEDNKRDPSPEESYAIGQCRGIIQGFMATYAMLSADVRKNAPDYNGNIAGAICFPDNIAVSDIIFVYLKWVKAHPDDWKKNYILGLFISSLESYPCLNKGAP